MGCEVPAFRQAPVKLEGKNRYKYVSAKRRKVEDKAQANGLWFFFALAPLVLSPELSLPVLSGWL